MESTARAAALAGLVAVAYFGTATGAMALTGLHDGTAIPSLPNGLLLAILLLCPVRLWAACLVASLLAELAERG